MPTLGFRVPDEPVAQAILERCGPLAVTSANRSGEPPFEKIEKIVSVFEDKVDLIIDAGNFTGKKPSTILDISSKPYRILRQGACDVPDELLK